MLAKTDFSPEEWQLVLSSPMLAGMAVTLAEPSGLWGLMQEGMANGRALLEAKSDPTASTLVKDIVADMATSEGRTAAREGMKALLTSRVPAELKTQALAALARVGAAVDAKGKGDSEAFKSWLKGVAVRVAEASTEGGFLGFGGTTVTDAEKASIDEVARALNIA